MNGVEIVFLPVPAGPLVGRLDNVFTWTHLRLPLRLLRGSDDLLHCPFYTLPVFCPCPSVVTIHDITFDLHPEWFTTRGRVAFGGFASASARKARRVLTVSECSRRDIIAAYGVPEERVIAVPLAADPEFRPVEDPATLRHVRRKYDLGETYLLHVGSITPRRNIPRLLEAFSRVRSRAPGLMLALAGRLEEPSPPLAPEIASRGLEGAVKVAGYVDAADLPALYTAATAVVYPSLYEGFGLPVLEAMACGAPVLASNASCLPEIAGDAALLVDPQDVEAMAAGIWSLLADAPLRARLAEKGRARAAAFSWQRTARETLEVYREALAGERSGGGPGAGAGISAGIIGGGSEPGP